MPPTTRSGGHIDAQTRAVVRSLLAWQRLSVTDAAKAAGMARRTLYRRLAPNAREGFRVRELEALAPILGVSLPQIVDGIRGMPELGPGSAAGIEAIEEYLRQAGLDPVRAHGLAVVLAA